MGTDDLFKKERRRKRERKESRREIKPDRILIVCEGAETEPNYFHGLKSKMDLEYRKRLDIQVEGVGKCTCSLIEHAAKLQQQAEVIYNEIWCVFDKDSFPDFDEAISLASRKDFKAAWSNESFELWFLLHFNYYDAQLGRQDYNTKLDQIFQTRGISNDGYKKNLKNIYEILSLYGSEKSAFKNADKLEKFHIDEKIPSNKNPMTRVHYLVNRLKEVYDF